MPEDSKTDLVCKFSTILNPMTMRFLTSFLFFLTSHFAVGQLVVDSAATPEQMIEDVLLGEGVQISNIQYTGDNRGSGMFTNDSKLLPFEKGIVM